MQKKKYYYLIKLQYLGFRFSGWQKQPGQKTIEGMLTKTLKYILPDISFKILGAGRTDAKVSALDAAFELFINEESINDLREFKSLFNKNLPSDIRIISVEETTKDFNIIQNSKVKEYIYLFSFGEKNHPFCAPFLTNIQEDLDLDLMKQAATYFVGTHDFSSFTARLQENTIVEREVISSYIKENEIITANFLPKKTYAFHVKGKGFIRYQIRMMMGALIQIGKGDFAIEKLKLSLTKEDNTLLKHVAPGSGLLLNSLEFN
ncbi:tRNA pseudouridine(38-40) synthase TruA [uncultured Maribacter sp.]|uniref:tRNA pseudouridine(38-40) synthase TruA n=1 Tax=uncultured Maribacter sp. TaxID=431308 RepID=UPI002628A3BF|nr:tRNA pseudouridine(38-40) synthase TruA [uncultured Maribacter sp.]